MSKPSGLGGGVEVGAVDEERNALILIKIHVQISNSSMKGFYSHAPTGSSQNMILIALGSNQPGPWGSPDETVARALATLDAAGFRLIRASRLLISAPFGRLNQPPFVNAVARIETASAARGPDAAAACHRAWPDASASCAGGRAVSISI